MRHLPPLLEYLDERSIGDILARHLDVAAALEPETRRRCGHPPDSRPARRSAPGPPAPLPDSGSAPTYPDPVRRMRRRLRASALLRDLRRNRGCPRRVAGLAGRRVREWTARYRMCCRCAATTSGRRAPSPARCWRRRSPRSSWREAEQRLAFAADAAAACRGSRRLLWLDRTVRFGAAPGAPRRSGIAAPRPRVPALRACPRGRRARIGAGRGAGRKRRRAPRLRERVWFVRPPCGAGDGDAGGIRLRRHRRADDPCPAGAAALGAGGAAAARRLAGPADSVAASNRRLGSGPARALPAPSSADRLTAPPRQRMFSSTIVGMEFPVTALWADDSYRQCGGSASRTRRSAGFLLAFSAWRGMGEGFGLVLSLDSGRQRDRRRAAVRVFRADRGADRRDRSRGGRWSSMFRVPWSSASSLR